MDRVQAHRLFQALNQERIHRLLALLPQRQQLVIELLPFLFHINAKTLPGYISDDTPAGVIDYRPDKAALDRASQLEKTFRYRRRALRHYPLRGLYLINTQGLLTADGQAPFQLFVLFNDKLGSIERQLLQDKLQAICAWAAGEGVNLQPRLFSEADLTRGVLSAWDRDQLYSCGLVLAGSQPYWWLTSPEEDADYEAKVAALKSQRLLTPVSLTDFGAVTGLDTDSLFHQSVHVFEQSLVHDNHYLPLRYLMLCLLQPGRHCLSPQLKKSLYQQSLDPAAIDTSYLRLLQVLEDDNDESLREAFYFSCREMLSKSIRQAPHPWRRQFIQSLVTEWGWDQDRLASLDDEVEDFTACQRRHLALGETCGRALKQLSQFASDKDLNADKLLARLKRLYQLRFHPSLERVFCLPSGLRQQGDANRLYLSRERESQDWVLSRQSAGHGRERLLAHASLIHLLAFAIGNGLLTRSNWISVEDQHHQVTTATVVEVSQQLLRSGLADNDLNPRLVRSAEPETLAQVWLFANLEQPVSDQLTQQGLQLSSKLSDPLNYSSFRQSLVTSISGLVVSSYGLKYSFSFEGQQAPLETLRYLLSWSVETDCHCHCWCPTPIFGQAIRQRLQSLCAQVFAHQQRFPEHGRYLLDIAARPYSLEWQDEQVEFNKRPLSQTLWQSLSQNQSRFIPLRLDSYLDNDGLFNHLLSHQSPDCISVFIYLEQQTLVCYVLDEFGNLLKQQFRQLTESTLITHFQHFLEPIRQQNHIAHLRFYRLQRQHKDWQSSPLAVTRQASGYLPVKVAMASTSLDAPCSVICGQRWFEGQADEAALFEQVQALVLALRARQQQFYPVYINQLQIEDGLYHPASTYLLQKQRLEQLFNPD